MRTITSLLYLIFISTTLSAQHPKYDQAVAAYSQGKFQVADQLFKEDLSAHPKHAEAHCYRALIALQQNNATDALQDANWAVKYVSQKNKTGRAWIHSIRALAYMANQLYSEAITDLNISIGMDTTVTEYFMERGAGFEYLKEYAAAEADYKHVLQLDPENESVRVALLNMFLNQQKVEEAKEYMDEWVKTSPKSPVGYYYKAKLEYNQQQWDEAIIDMLKSFTLNETNDEVYQLFAEYAAKNYRLAINKLDELIQEYPYYDKWYLVRAFLHEQNNDYELAIKDYTRYAELTDNQNKAIILPNRANCYTETGDYIKALTDFNESLKTDSMNARTYAFRGDTRRLLGEYSQAIQDFNKAIQLDSTESWFYYRRGWIKDEFIKDWQGGLDDYNRAIAIDKNYAYTYLHRGRLYEMELKDTVKAKADYETILKLDTVITKNGNCRQYALFQLGRVNEAIEWSDKILESFPNEGNYYDVACLFSQLKQPAKAIDYLRKSFELGNRNFIHIMNDDDLDNIRQLADFKTLIQAWKNKQK